MRIPNAAHLTIVNVGGAWHMAYDFRYNRARIQEHLDAAAEFVSSSHHAIDSGHARAAVDHLFSAAELTANAILLAIPDQKFLDPGKSHGFVAHELNFFGGKLGNVDGEFVAAFNTLRDRRLVARYLRSHQIPTLDECKRMLEAIEHEIDDRRKSFDPRRVDK